MDQTILRNQIHGIRPRVLTLAPFPDFGLPVFNVHGTERAAIALEQFLACPGATPLEPKDEIMNRSTFEDHPEAFLCKASANRNLRIVCHSNSCS